MRREATILRDNGGYDAVFGEMNPVIFEEFMGVVLDRGLPPVIWEPFSTGSGKFNEMVEEVGVRLVAHSLNRDSCVRIADSTVTGPEIEIGGMLFHPTYFGSPPLAADDRDLGCVWEKDEYKAELVKTVKLAKSCMAKDGLACAVGRDYRAWGERIRLDHWYLDLFRQADFELESVWSSEPDVALLFRSI